MPINHFKCPVCKSERESMKAAPRCNHGQEEEGEPVPTAVMEKQLSAPQAKFMEPTNKERGKSQLQGQKQMLMERAKEHARQNDYHDLAQSNDPQMAKRQGWVSEDGTIRKKLDNK